MISQKRSTLKKLQDDMRAGNITKNYIALLKGVVLLDKQLVDSPLLKYELPNGERRVRVAATGKPSKTEFTVLNRFNGATLVNARLLTGRTHQIRVHGLSIGHPLLGDEKYGHETIYKGPAPRRLCLHAARLVVPNYKPFESPIPEDMQTVIDALK